MEMKKKARRYTAQSGSSMIAIQYTGDNAGEVFEFCGGYDGVLYVDAKGAHLRRQGKVHEVRLCDYICMTADGDFFLYPQEPFESAYKEFNYRMSDKDRAMEALHEVDEKISNLIGIDPKIKSLVIEEIRTAKIWLYRGK